MSNAKIEYIAHREFAIEKLRAIRLLAKMGHRPEAGATVSDWSLNGSVTWVSQSKRLRIHADEISGKRVEFFVEISQTFPTEAAREFLELIESVDKDNRYQVRKALVPFATMLRNFGAGTQYRVRTKIEFQDLMSFSGMSLDEPVPSLPALISMASLEVKRVHALTMQDLQNAMTFLESEEYAYTRRRRKPL